MNRLARTMAMGSVLLLSGCFHMSGNLDTQVMPVSQLQSSRTEDLRVPGSDIVTVETTLDGSMLAIKADVRRQCRPTVLETWQNYDKSVVSLPTTHWLVFGSGVLAAAGGGAVAGIGMMYTNQPAANAVLTPAEETDRDTGVRMLYVGAAAAGFGLSLLISELIDAVSLEDTRQPTEQVVKPIPGEARVCDEGPAKHHPIWFETLPSGTELGQRVTVSTDDFGRASIDLRDPKFDTFPYGDPFAVVTCEHCAGWNLTLLPDAAANLAIHRKDREALQSWMDTNARHASEDIIVQVKEALTRRRVVDLGNAITFTLGSARLRRSAGPHLDRTAEFLLKRRGLQLRIEGHTDDTGTLEQNKVLSKRRAEAVKKYLMRRGVPGERLITVGMAANRPVKSNRNERGRQANRRYHFQLLED